MPTVYRVQSRFTGQGPWKACFHAFNSVWIKYRCTTDPRYCGPVDDNLDHLTRGSNRYYYVFGCPSKKSLKAWFGVKEIIDLLNDTGFVIAEFKVRPEFFIRGANGHQVGFRRDKAQLVQYHAVDKLRNGQKF